MVQAKLEVDRTLQVKVRCLVYTGRNQGTESAPPENTLSHLVNKGALSISRVLATVPSSEDAAREQDRLSP